MKKKLFPCYIFLICLLMLCCIVLFVLDRKVYFYEDLQSEVPVYGSIEKNISLKPGIYEIIQKYTASQDYAGMCTVTVSQGEQEKEDPSTAWVFTNGEHFYSGRQQTGFLLWNWKNSDRLQVVSSCDIEGTRIVTGQLIVRNTGKLWLVLMTLLGALLACSFLVRWLLTRKEYGKTALTLLVITLLASLPSFSGGLLGGADLTYHLQRIEGVAESLKSMQFPLRIEPQWLYGHGYANGIFYCNSLLYLPGVLRLLGFTVTSAYKVYCVTLNFATAAIAMYCFGKILGDRRIGAFCSALYTLSCPRIYKFMMVAAVGEGSAMAFLPLVFYGMYRILTEDSESDSYRSSWIPAALGYAGLMQTHVLTCEVTAFLTLVTCIICIRRVLRKKVFINLLKAAGVAVSLSLWYLVPFFDYYLTQDMHIRHVSGRTIQERGLYFRQLFVNNWSIGKLEKLGQYGMTNTEQISAGWLFMAALGGFVLLWLLGKWRVKSIENRTAKLCAGLAVLCLAMSLRCFPWDRIQQLGSIPAALVSSLQFPYRFMGWGMVFLTMVTGRLFGVMKKQKSGRIFVLAVVCFSICSSSVPMMRHAIMEEDHLYLYNPEGMGFGYISGEEYLVEGTEASRLTFEGPVCGEKIRMYQYEAGSLSATMELENDGPEESYVDLPLLRYKGYRVVQPRDQLDLTDGENHKLRLLVPADFSGRVQVAFVSPWYWRGSELFSILAVAVVLNQWLGKSSKKLQQEKQ